MSILQPGTLLIWLPGLLFLASLVYLSLAVKKGSISTAVQYAPVVLLLVSVMTAYIVPKQDMARALRFANAHEAHAGAPVTDYAQIDYAAKDAWLKTALPPEERGEDLAAGGGDVFSFGDEAEGDAATEQPVVVADPEALALVYQPAKGVAWMILVLLLIGGSLFFLRDPKSFRRARGQ